MSEEKSQTIQVVKRSLKVLERLVNKEKPVGLTSLAEELSIPPSTLYRVLTTLKEAGFVKQSPETSKYSLGSEFYFLSLSVLQRTNLQNTVRPFLQELMEETSETTNLVVLGSDLTEVVYVQQVTSNATVKGFSLIGNRAPSYATAVGKVLLADLDWPRVSEALGEVGLEQLTEHTITEMSELRDELEQVRSQGFAVDKEETEQGAACIAAPVKNNGGEVVAAVSISGPTSRILGESLPNELVESVKRKARQMSKKVDMTYQEQIGVRQRH